MNNRQIPELMKFIIDNSEATDMQASLKDLKRDMDAFKRTVESSTNALTFYQDKMKRIATEGSQAGYARQEIVVNKADAENVFNALLAKNAQMGARRDWQYDIQMQAAPIVKGTMTLVGEEARKIARAEAQRHGGDIWDSPTKSNPNRVEYFYQTDDTNKRNKTGIFKEAKSWSKAETVERDRLSFLAQDKEENKKQAARTLASAKKSRTIFKGILTFVAIGVDILRRLLNKSLEQASLNNKEGTQAHALGMTILQSREYNLFDKAHGMNQGTTVGAVQDIQSKFGDVTNLDEGALGVLARVMGGDVAALVNSGMGGDSPDVLLEKILDKYFQQFKEGKNSLGQQVGQNAAMRELATSLGGVSENLATLFLKMADDYMSGAYGDFSSTKEWRDTTQTNMTGLTDIDTMYNTEIGKQLEDIKNKMDQIKAGVLMRIANSLGSILNWISNLRWGMSDSEKINLDAKNKKANEETAKRLKEEMAGTEAAIANTATGKDVLSRASGKGISLRQIMLAGSGVWKKSDFARKEDYNRAIGFYEELMAEESLLPLLGLYGADATYYSKELSPELSKMIGSNIDNKTISDIAMTFRAREFIANNYHKSESTGILGTTYSRELNKRALQEMFKENPLVLQYLKGMITGKNTVTDEHAIAYGKGVISTEEFQQVQAYYSAWKNKHPGESFTDKDFEDLIIRGILLDSTFWLPNNAASIYRGRAETSLVNEAASEAALWKAAFPYLADINTSGYAGMEITSGRKEGGEVININLVDAQGRRTQVQSFETGERGTDNASIYVDFDDENRAVLSAAK